MKPTRQHSRHFASGRRIIMLLLMGLLAPAAVAHAFTCNPRARQKVGTVRGIVRDRLTTRPISGAIVSWALPGEGVAGTTDSNGEYAFSVPYPAGGTTPEAVEVSILANPYVAGSRTARICPGSTATVNVWLRQLPSTQRATVSGHVINSSRNLGVEGAVVTIGQGTLPLGRLSAVTDSDGFYSIGGVGFASNLTIGVSTDGPPCLTPTTRQLSVASANVTEDFVQPEVITEHVRCPPNQDGPEPEPESAAGIESAPLPDDSSITWHLASAAGIQTNPGADAWNAGHINAIVKVGPSSAIVGSDCGGVWSVAWTSSSAAAVPVSYLWQSNCVASMANGPDGSEHIYAGTQDPGDRAQGGFLFETDTSSIAPLVNWVEDTPKPPCKNIYDIAIDRTGRRIVLACDSGVFWSPIPGSPSAHGAYSWSVAVPASTLPPGTLNRVFSGLAISTPAIGGVGTTVVAAVNGGNFPNDVIYYGGWEGGNLVLNAANVPTSAIVPSRTSVAACPADPDQMYAAIADYNSGYFLGAVWNSVDGGKNWSAVSSPANAGNAGNYNNVIAVSPSDCLTFAIGWRDHVFVSYDAGTSYTPLDIGCNPSTKACDGHLHTDYHALTFDPLDPTTLFIGGDGGMASASGVFKGSTPVLSSYYNEHLSNLEFGTGDASALAGSRSSAESGLLAGSLQDNGVVYNDLLGQGRWLPVVAGDGITATFAGVGPNGFSPRDTLVSSNNSGHAIWEQSIWDGSTMTSQGVIPVMDSSNPRDPAGVNAGGPGLLARVPTPSFSNALGELMYAIGAGRLQPSTIVGLFARTDGSDIHWETVASVGTGQIVTALSSANGSTIFAGTDKGTIFNVTLTSTKKSIVQMTVIPPLQGVGSIRAIEEPFSSIGFAATDNGSVLVFLGQSWSAAGGGLPSDLPFYGVAVPDLGSVFASTRQQVYVSHDLGSTWATASDGLPAVSQGKNLRYVKQADGSRFLYLATYGWSMFRALLP